jgi:phosphoserine phosphatase
VSDDGRSILNNADKARLGDHIIGIFPEGKRSRDGHLQELRSGVAVLAKKHNLPILPLGLNGFYEAWQPNAKYPSPHPMHVVVGDLIDSYGNIRQMLDTVQDQLSLVSTSTLDISNVTSAFIDVDKTLTDTSIADLLFYVKKRTLSPVRYRLWYLKVAMLAPVLRLLDKVYRPLVQVIVYQMYAGIPQSTLKQHARDYYSSTMRSKVYPETAAIIDQLTKQGAAITLVSTNLDVTLGNLASDYEVELRAIDLRYLQGLPLLKKLKYLSQFKDTVMQQEATPSSLAIGDSKYDKPLFEKCTWSILKASSSIDRRLAGLVHQVM